MVTRKLLALLLIPAVFGQDFAALIGPFLGQGGAGGADFGKIFSAFQGILNHRAPPPPTPPVPTPAPAPAPAPQTPAPPPAASIPVPEAADYD